MTSADALAAAIRGRLVAGRPAPLPGLGTLVRQHVPARIETQPDGSRTLLPPGETVGLAAGGGAADPLAPAFARVQGLPPGGADAAFAEAMDQVEARLAASGEVRLPGVGLLRRTSRGVVLAVEADLLSAVNRTYEGLLPIAAPPAPGAASAPPPATDAGPTGDGEGRDALPDEPPPVLHDGGGPETPDDPSAAPEETPDGATAEGETATGLAVPFGGEGEPTLEDLLRPTPPAADPTLRDAPEPEEEPDDDGLPDTWTAADAEPPPTLLDDEGPVFEDTELVEDAERAEDAASGPPSRPRDGGPPPQADAVEEAAFESVAEAPPFHPAFEDVFEDIEEPPHEADRAPAGSPEEPAPVASALERYHGVPIERVEPGDPGPLSSTGRTAGVLAAGSFVGLEGVEAPPRRAPGAAPGDDPVEPPPAEPARRSPWLWALAVVVALALLALLLFLWSLSAAGAADSAAGPTETEAATLAPVEAAGDGPPAGGAAAGGAAGPTAASRDQAGGGVPAPPPDAAPRASDGGGAALPPRLAGLAQSDVAALSGGPIDVSADGWTLVVFSTRSRAVAESHAARYREAGYRTAVVPGRAGGRTWYRVGVGQFASEADADRLRDRLPPQAPPGTWALPLRS